MKHFVVLYFFVLCVIDHNVASSVTSAMSTPSATSAKATTTTMSTASTASTASTMTTASVTSTTSATSTSSTTGTTTSATSSGMFEPVCNQNAPNNPLTKVDWFGVAGGVASLIPQITTIPAFPQIPIILSIMGALKVKVKLYFGVID